MSSLSRGYLAIYVQMLRWALTQQLEFALTRHGSVTPHVGHRPSFKAELLAASNYGQQRSGRGMARTAGRGLERRRADGALP
jgi:hypothetical protein